MPSSICEAMLCECIPVGSDVNGIPKIINGYGIIINERKTEKVFDAIKQALKLENSYGSKAREFITENFNIHLRESQLLTRINLILKNKE